ncbi:chromosome segregation protein SMC [Atopobium sp. oral taxon 416]|uniref:chromosome segregation protein SMC n=1 Tax=Atopobium sp. oral taxon 416 TaxID=712157 RepID=UPI001BA8C432|nr:chromosome segregation protein SMC [Atopobium sp. oral taxon 416]QUC04741.1 chromosome segregation protein SMC [Atopobium sp. oral taxon 416]
MYLKSLTLKGFKSFADKTQMTFDPGLNVVVGLNGSGKSNISDAILWVLGEQSAKMLRGQAMQDVIFSGSSVRPAVGLAEVTMVLDNHDHTLPIDFDEVGITRRMYRSGESEYLINGSPARLMDIQDILHDSGLGKDTHSIISQGKLDSVLASRPEDRRELIEEAAGISKHRKRKERSERKIKSMDQSLTRAKDVQREINRQLRPLERQVGKAQKSHALNAELKEITTILATDDLRQLQLRSERLDKRKQGASAAIDAASHKLDQKRQELEKLQSLLGQKGLLVGNLGEQRSRMREIQSRMSADLRLINEKEAHTQSRVEELTRSHDAMREQYAQTDKALREAQQEQETVEEKKAALTKQIDELSPRANQAAQKRRELSQQISKLNNEVRAVQKIRDQESLTYAQLEERLKNAHIEAKMFEGRLKGIKETLGTAQEVLTERKGRQEGLNEAQAKAQQESDEAAQKIKDAEAASKQAHADRDDAQKKLNQAQATLRALRSVDSSQQDANLLSVSLAKNEDVRSAVQCRLADVLEVPQELDSLVERLLGDDMRALVVTDTDKAKDIAKTALSLGDTKGQATILSEDLKAQPLEFDNAPGEALLDSIYAVKGSEQLLQALLGDVRIVDSVEEALTAHQSVPAATYATRDGAVLMGDGRLIVGATSACERGLLERNRRIYALEASMDDFEDAFHNANEALSKRDRELVHAREAQTKAKGQLASLQAEINSVGSEIARLEAQQRRLNAEQVTVEKQRKESEEAHAKDMSEVSAHKRRADEAEKQVEKLTQDLNEAVQQGGDASHEENQVQRNLADAKLQLATVTEHLKHVHIQVQEQTSRRINLKKNIERAEHSLKESQGCLKRFEPLKHHAQALIDSAEEWAKKLRDRASLAEADTASLKKTITDAKQAVSYATDTLEKERKTAQELEVEQGKLEVQVSNAVAAITDTGAVLEEALKLPEPENRPEMEVRARDIKQQLAEIGPVNEVAMDEYSKLKERADYIHDQVQDLQKAREALKKITAAIERKMKNRFLTIFEQVNANFQQIFGMLFPGGHAYLEMSDPDHLAETGIEVVAQPVGKKITKMTLMSGGEKSLTALALLFAVYKTRTVPFYLFDEVEAALDESNLGKLLMAIDMLKENTQLIVISHQRRTMEQADVLYGVSMQADGVSHVVSQRLDRRDGKVVEA